jgi:hypothetical protein
VRVEITVNDRLRQQVEVVQALGHVQGNPELRQDVHGASLFMQKTEKRFLKPNSTTVAINI